MARLSLPFRSKILILGGAVALLGGFFYYVIDAPSAAKDFAEHQKSTRLLTSRKPSPSHAKNASSSGRQAATALENELETLLADPNTETWNAQLDELFKNLSVEELQKILATSLSKEWPKSFFDHVTFAIHHRWLDLDPIAAIRSADQGGISSDLKARWLRVAMTTLAAQSPEEAFKLIDNQEIKGLDSQDGYGSIAAGAAKLGSTDLVNRALARITNFEERLLALNRLVGDFAETKDADFVNAWIATLPEHEQADAMIESAVTFAAVRPDLTSATLQEIAARDSQLYAITVSRVLSKWAAENPAGTAVWFLSQPFNATQKPQMLTNLLQIWQAQDRAAADRWLDESLKNGSLDQETVREALGNL